MRRRIIVSLLLFLLALWPVMALAQLKIAVDDAQKHKLSMTTRMFISELNDGGFDPVQQEARQRARRAKSGLPVISEPITKRRSKNDGRIYAAPDTINGRAYVSAFITLEDNSDVSALEALGVKVRCKFNDGLITSDIPVEKISDVAALRCVKDISVAKIMEPTTNLARIRTNVDDILNLSDAALNASLNTKYDGTGVLLGIIDRGIDFLHIAFQDKDGNSRIVRAWDGKQRMDFGPEDLANHPTDTIGDDHGTHTASTAGGSSVIIDGYTVTVTDNHASATYGGMAPGTSLYLCGLNKLRDTDEAECIQKICKYGDDHGMPVVISNSYGSFDGPCDGVTMVSPLQKACADYFNDNIPNHICLFSSGNNANKSFDNEGGGNHVGGYANSEHPLGTILRQFSRNYDNGTMYDGALVAIWSRTPCLSGINLNLYVLDRSSGKILNTIPIDANSISSIIGSGNPLTISLDEYYTGQMNIYAIDYGKKQQIILEAIDVVSPEKNKHTLALDVSPVEGNCYFDIWANSSPICVYLTNHISTTGHEWTAGTDDISVYNEATFPNVISVGAYVSRTVVVDCNNVVHNEFSKEHTLGDIAPFSSYVTKAQSLTDEFYPWITAPGAQVIAAVNSRNIRSHYLQNEFGTGPYRVNNSIANPYGNMEGTSMACPVVAGIVALWLQAAKEVGLSLTTSDVKEIMANTAIKDGFVTDSTNSSHFGNGKIDALAGIAYILEKGRKPMIQATPLELSFDGPVNEQQSQKVNVKGIDIKGDITVTLTDESGAFSIDKTNIAASTEGVDIIVTWVPTESGSTTATLTLSAEGAEDVVINMTAHSEVTTVGASTTRVVLSTRAGTENSQLLKVLGRYLTGDITLSITGDNDVFSVTPTTIYQNNAGKLIDVVVTFAPSSPGNYSGVLSIMSNGVETISIILNGTGTDGLTELSRYEYWFDNDVNHIISGTISGYEADIDVNVNTQHLSDGLHTVNIRVKQSGGEYDYSPLTTKVFFKHNKEEGGQIVYWFDDNDIDTQAGSTSILEIEEPQLVTLDLSDNDKFPLGLHTLNMRIATKGKSLGSIFTARVLKMSAGKADHIEYWVDDWVTDDGVRSKVKTVTGHEDSSDDNCYIFDTFDLSDVSAGLHCLYYRAASSEGLTNSAVSMTPVLVKPMFRTERDATLTTFRIGVDNETIEVGPLNGKDEQLFSYSLDATGLSFGKHTLKTSFWNSYDVGITELTPFLVVEHPAYIKGDVNGDGDVDLADAVIVINHYVGKPVVTFNAEAADIDGDSVIDLADAVKIINYYVGKIPSLSRKHIAVEKDSQ